MRNFDFGLNFNPIFLGFISGGNRLFDAEQEDLSSSSFSSASRASLDPPSSPTPSCSGDNILHFPGDSSGSV